jgi:hypothetical protein
MGTPTPSPQIRSAKVHPAKDFWKIGCLSEQVHLSYALLEKLSRVFWHNQQWTERLHDQAQHHGKFLLPNLFLFPCAEARGGAATHY